MTLRAILAVALCLIAACASAPPTPQTTAQAQEEHAPVILISIDGFRPDYLDRGQTPTLSRLAADGVRGIMRSSFPTVTFPNHYTLVTGLRPDRNGMINNKMEDPSRPGVVFAINNNAVASDEFWWDQAIPIWVSAERQGVHAGTMFWPGSDFAIHGVRPTRWRAFDQSLPSFARVDTLLSWFDLPAAERPRFFTLYFDIVDTAGHRYGPDAQDTTAAASEVDAAMARLLAGLRSRGLEGRVNLVIVSDHGMSAVSEDRVINFDALAPLTIARVVWDGPFIGVEPQPGKDAELVAAVVGRKEHGECWRKRDVPARFHYGANARVPAIICLADRGWRYRTASIAPYPSAGNHGYDPEDPEMAAIFIANGPVFKHGATLPTFDNVSVYPLLTRLLGITPEPNDGALSDTAAALN